MNVMDFLRWRQSLGQSRADALDAWEAMCADSEVPRRLFVFGWRQDYSEMRLSVVVGSRTDASQ